ncbi:hypothetical protein BKA64DRAFT_160222 [Cadophora sp. MPI-SDFR-AT-0126]|nr:hypothetical protein BKA64DRAFT_160222 [Leotiomycetes sp. MPI-SDFR-AT-0126]
MYSFMALLSFASWFKWQLHSPSATHQCELQLFGSARTQFVRSLTDAIALLLGWVLRHKLGTLVGFAASSMFPLTLCSIPVDRSLHYA